MAILANASQIGLEALANALEPPPAIDYLEFVEDHITIGEGAFPGPYSRILFPYFDEVLRALSPADPCRYVTLQASAQVGKTLIATAFAIGSVTLGRGLTLLLHPTEENALRFSKIKLEALMRSTPIVADHFPKRSRDSQSAILFKQRDDGMAALLISGANSPASLSQITVSNLVMDDVAKFESSAAGDPEVMAESRCRAIAEAKIFRISTPLVAPGCRITRSFMEGSQELPYVPCPHCSEMQVLEWENMLAGLDLDHPEDVHFSCIGCGGIIEEHHRPGMLAGFEWRAQNPSAMKHHRSFWIWSAYSYLQSFEQIAREYIKTKGDPSGEQVFLNDVVGKAYAAHGTGRPWEELRNRAAKSHYHRGTVPEGALVLTLGLDLQMDRCEWVLIGHGRQYRRYIIDCGVIGNHISERDAQNQISELMERTWPNFRGHRMGVKRTCIDGNFETDTVLEFCRKFSASRIVAVRGNPGDAAPRIAKIKRERNERKGTLLRYQARFFNLGVNQLKSALYRDLAKDDPLAPGYVAFPQGLDDSFFQQLVSETRVAKKVMGRIIWGWDKPERQPNEALDMTVYASAAAIMVGVYQYAESTWRELENRYNAITDQPVPSAPRVSMGQRLFEAAGQRAARKQYPVRRL